MKMLVAALALLGLALWPTVGAAREATYQARADQLLSILSAPGGEDAYFSTLFLDAVPVAQWRALAADLRKQYGKPLARGAVQVESPTTGEIGRAHV